MVNPKKIYIAFVVAAFLFIILLFMPVSEKGKDIDKIESIEELINLDFEKTNFLNEMKILNDEVMIDFINNYENIIASIENDNLRLIYLNETTSYLIINLDNENGTYLERLKSYENTIKKYQKITDNKIDRYMMLQHFLEVIENKKIEIEIYDNSFKFNQVNASEEVENIIEEDLGHGNGYIE
jgi:hypothetical protein